MKNWRVRSADPEVAPDAISADDLARRIGATPVRSPEPDERPDRRKATTPDAARLSSVHHAHPVAGSGSRGLLWRDASALLFSVVGIILVAQLALGNLGGSTLASAAPVLPGEPSDAAILGQPGSGATSGPTLGPILDPNLIPAILARPTPIPVITLPPATTRPATPRPTVRPQGPTQAPTRNPSSSSTPPPTPIPSLPAGTPAPSVTPGQLELGAISCTPSTVVVNQPMDCAVAIKSGTADGYWWDFGDGTGASHAATHTYVTGGAHVVSVTVTGVGGPLTQTAFLFVQTP